MSKSSELVLLKPSNNLPMVLEENGLFSYLEKIKKFPVLSEEEEKSLILDLQTNGNLNAAHTLITSHLRLAAKIALSYRRYGLPMADLISEANIGLMQAVKKFDLEKKVRLSTYAMWWIRAAINDYVLRSWSLVKIGTASAQKKLFYNLARIKSRLGLNDNKSLSPDEVKTIATELVVNEHDVVDMNQRLSGDKSLNVCISDDGEEEKIDLLADKSQNIEASAIAKDEAARKHKILYAALAKLNDREQFILKNRMLTDSPITLEEIGVKFGISRERTRQIEKRAFEKLSEFVKSDLSLS